MTIYVALVEDRHFDNEVYLFSSPNKAIAFAKKIAQEYIVNRPYADIDDTENNTFCKTMNKQELKKYDYLFFCQMSLENDCVSVFAKEVDED